MSVPIKKSLIWENIVKLTILHFVSKSCTDDSASYAVIKRKIHVKSCKISVKSSCELKNAHI